MSTSERTQGHMMRYRPEIDGLRAIAVLAVILFHSGIPAFSGGYVGVDVFFVISGYVITRHILSELSKQSFSLVAFYERRARRILPAYFTVSVFCLAMSLWILVPSDLRLFGRSLSMAGVFCSNLLFWRKSDYFDVATHYTPFLHTWSLGVEEQFYIFFPLTLLVLWRVIPKYLISSLIIIIIASLLISEWGARHFPMGAFFLAPSRAWELLLGAVVVRFVDVVPTGRFIRELIDVVGMALIGWGISQFSGQTSFPGFNALVPTIGVALLLAHEGRSVVKSFLSMRPLIFIGLISYSLYLWHWPLLVFAKLWSYSELLPLELGGVFLLSVGIATLSWRYVEQPVRVGLISPRKSLFSMAGCAIIINVACGLYLDLGHGLPGRFDESVARLDGSRKDSNPDRHRCHASDAHPITFGNKCVYGAAMEPTVVLWGDSHASEIAPVLGDIAKTRNKSFKYVSYSACPPALNFARKNQPLCTAHNDEVFQGILANPRIERVILIAHYSLALEIDAEGFVEGFKRLVEALRAAGREVFIIYPLPEFSLPVPQMLARQRALGLPVSKSFISETRYESANSATIKFLDTLTLNTKSSRVVPSDLLCRESLCMTSIDGNVLYLDSNHLSLAGARLIAPLLMKTMVEPASD